MRDHHWDLVLVIRQQSRQVPAKVFGDLEHCHLVLTEYLPELVVGQDFSAVLRVLAVVRFDVFPKPAHGLGPGQWLGTDDPQRAPMMVSGASVARLTA
jgi:hypothetical protein